MARFNGEIMDLFSSRSPREEEEVSLLGWSWMNLQRIWISAKKTAFSLRLVQDLDRSKWPAFTSFYEGSNSGYAIKPKYIGNTVEYIAAKSFLFNSFKKK